jgi:hypothetical protein
VSTVTYPPTEKKDFVFAAASGPLSDPYAWLEEDNARTLSWQAEQNALAERELRTWPGYERLAALAARSAAPARYPRTNWRPAGAHRFALARPTGSEAVCLLVAGEDVRHPKVLYDP